MATEPTSQTSLDAAMVPKTGSAMATWMDSLHTFTGEPAEFLKRWLAGAGDAAGASCGAVLHASENKELHVLSLHPAPPEDALPPAWLRFAADRLKKGPITKPEVLGISAADGMYHGEQGEQILLMPLPLNGATSAVGAWAFGPGKLQLSQAADLLTSLTGLLRHYEERQQAQKQLAAMGRLRGAVELQTQMQSQSKSLGAAMAMCNELASRYQAERVCVGVLRHRGIKLLAMDHTEKIGGKMQVIRQIETAMEECLDQDHVVFYPAPVETPAVSRAAGELARREGAAQVVSLPIRQDGETVMVLTMELSAEKAIAMEGLESLRLLAELVGPRLYERHLHDRWFGAKGTRTVRHGLAWVLGAKHTWVKLLSLLILGAALFSIFVEGDYNIEAPLRLDSVSLRIAAAPSESYLLEVLVQPGQQVRKGDVLARLDETELQKKLASLRSQLSTHRREMLLARRESQTAEMQIAQAKADQVTAQIDLAEYQLSRLVIKSPIDGFVVSPDLSKQIGKAVKTGEGLFEIAAVGSMRAVFRVPEEDIPPLKVGQKGFLAVTAHPKTKLPFVVERIHPTATSEKDGQDRKNTFEVWARLVEKPDWLRPGMEGEAEIQIGQRRYAWLWTHRLTDWVTMKWWEWF